MSTANLSLPESFKVVDATAGCVTTFGGITSSFVSLKHAHKAWIALLFTQAGSDASVIQPQVATAVAPTGATNITFAASIWANEDTAASDILVKQTSATSYTLTADIAKKMVIIEIDPSDVVAMGVEYDCLGLTIAAGQKATNFVAGYFILAERFAQGTPPTAVTD